MLNQYEQMHDIKCSETPYRRCLKEIFRFNDHVEMFTFRNDSLRKLIDDQMDPRKHVSVDSVEFI